MQTPLAANQTTAEHSSETMCPRRLSIGKRLAFIVAAVVGFFLLLEGTLAVLGFRPVTATDDPWVGFTSTRPLFVATRESSGVPLLATSQTRLKWFNEQTFPRIKPQGTYRIFCLGGSTTYGRPYTDSTSFCGWLRELLPVADGSRNWEVINAGGISYASYRVALILEELTQYQPDLFVIYTGHNEFLERRTYSDLIEMPAAARGLGALLGHTRTYSLLQRLLNGVADDSGGEREGRTLLPGDVQALLDSTVGPQAYTRDDEFARQVVAHFRFNLGRMIDMARAAGSEVLLVTPASNLRGVSPFKSELADDLAPAQAERVLSLLARAETALRDVQLEAALASADATLAIDGRCARAHYVRGRILHELGRFAEAKLAFVRARDEDVCPLRAISAIVEAVAEIAAERDVPLIDFVSHAEARSPHGITDDEQFLDHVHPTTAANRTLAVAMIEELARQDVVEPSADWGEAAIERVSRRVEEGLDNAAHGRALRNLSKVFGWAGKREEAGRLALRAVELAPDDSEAWHQAANALLDQGEFERAIERFEQALQLDADYAEAHYGLGVCYDELKVRGRAQQHYRRAVDLDPDFADAWFNLGVIHESTGDLDAAKRSYRSALRANSNHFYSMNNLGAVLARQGSLDEAQQLFEQAVSIAPHYADAHANLGHVHRQRGNRAAAARHFRLALEAQPNHPVAAEALRLRNDP